MWISDEERNYRKNQEDSWERIKEKAGRAKRKKKERKRIARASLKQKNDVELIAAAKRTAEFLPQFWERFNSANSAFGKRVALISASNPGWPRVSQRLRDKLRLKYFRKYNSLLDGIDIECGCCGSQKWREKHHIVPLAYGGTNTNENLLAICEECHNSIHPWMKVVG